MRDEHLRPGSEMRLEGSEFRSRAFLLLLRQARSSDIWLLRQCPFLRLLGRRRPMPEVQWFRYWEQLRRLRRLPELRESQLLCRIPRGLELSDRRCLHEWVRPRFQLRRLRLLQRVLRLVDSQLRRPEFEDLASWLSRVNGT